ncbi:MAG: Ig-like domain-containing protein [Bacteroidales bacterium]|nr:Ig-like domain-containing protein [Bacteroidales bacterium]
MTLKKYIPEILAAIVFLPMLFVHSCANTTQSPTGGDKDTIPPLIIGIDPLPGAVNVPCVKTKIVFRFDEYVTIKNPKNILLSPPQAKAPKSRIREKYLIIQFEEPLDSNTTYTLHLSDAIADNNEGNMFPGYTYVFSTGSTIDSLLTTGKVLDCNTLRPVKGATVLLYKDLADSAVFLHRPDAAVKTDDWGWFCLPYLADTTYRLYALKDEAGDFIYDPEADLVGFVDSLIRPSIRVVDTIPEMLKYDMLDTLMCEARKAEHKMRLFREKPSLQYLAKRERTADRAGYITFNAPYAWIDSVWVRGYRSDELISQFNVLQDSLEFWVNSRKPAPDTLHVFVNYRMTDSTGVLSPSLEHLRLPMPEGKRVLQKMQRKNIKPEDTTCVFKLTASPETVEQYGFELMFNSPIIYEHFDSLDFRYLNPKQKEFRSSVTVERDTANLRRYIVRPAEKLLPGYEYTLRVPHHSFRDINGFWSDSTKVKVSLPTDEKLSSLTVHFTGVNGKVIIDLQDDKRKGVLRTYIIDTDADLEFPYLKEGKYAIRITDDGNRNSIVDTGSLLGHRQPETVTYATFNGEDLLDIPASSEVEQSVDIQTLFDEL